MNYLITGANRGIGLEFVKQLTSRGETVLATCRSPKQAEELNTLANTHKDLLTIIKLDVADTESIDNLLSYVKKEDLTFDVLINNAGINPQAGQLGELDYDVFLKGFEVNSIAPLRLAEALLPRLTGAKKIINLTSKMGSVEDNTSGGAYAYRMSKAALNIGFKSFAIDTKSKGVTSLVMHPGWVMTDMGGPNALITVEQSVSGLLNTIDNATLEQSGNFYGWEGNIIPW